MGGLIRARDYVRLPPTARENTIMIMLMNDREELADGSYLKEGTLYNQWAVRSTSRIRQPWEWPYLQKSGTGNDSTRYRVCF